MTVEWPMTTELNPLTGMIHEGRRDRGGGGLKCTCTRGLDSGKWLDPNLHTENL